METELRRARGHAKAAITNRSKEIIHLMKNKENEELVHRKLAELNEAQKSQTKTLEPSRNFRFY